MFQPVGDLVTRKWVRENPFVLQTLAVAEAALGIPIVRIVHNREGKQEVDQGTATSQADSNDGDEQDGTSKVKAEEPQQEDKKAVLLVPKIIDKNFQNQLGELQQQQQSDPDTSDWGWFVTVTPPQQPQHGKK